jgi:hypothetical protein
VFGIAALQRGDDVADIDLMSVTNFGLLSGDDALALAYLAQAATVVSPSPRTWCLAYVGTCLEDAELHVGHIAEPFHKRIGRKMQIQRLRWATITAV